MTPKIFKAIREMLGYSQQALADEWGMGKNGGRTIRRWESGERPLSPIAAYAILKTPDPINGEVYITILRNDLRDVTKLIAPTETPFYQIDPNQSEKRPRNLYEW
jgi:transcriptional regulator with XRE-family HTH domain